jgi:RNA polymerase sigma-70 factor, ECF subfamily
MHGRPTVQDMIEVTGRGGAAPGVDGAEVGVEVVEAIRAGDEATFVWIVRVWSPFLLRTATVLTGDRDTAQSVVRETWLRVLADVPTFRPPPLPRAWVCALMLSALDLPRQVRAVESSDEPVVHPARFLPPDHDQWPGHWAMPPAAWPAMDDSDSGRRGVGAALWSALTQLPTEERVVVSLRDVAGCEVPEIGQIMGQHPDRVRLLLHRGRSAVRRQLESHFVEARSA